MPLDTVVQELVEKFGPSKLKPKGIALATSLLAGITVNGEASASGRACFPT